MWHGGKLVDAAGNVATAPGDDAVVSLWHPLEAANEDVAAWRAFLMQHRLVQPFKQAHRELYPITDAEQQTGTYSNRFAGHILRQHQSVTLARLRGWQATMRICADVSNDRPTHLRIPDFELAAEFWTEGAGDDQAEVTDNAAYVFILTNRVRFRRLSDGILGDGVALEAVPARVFSEVMRDCDLFVGVASIGNDPDWIDAGADAAHGQWRRKGKHLLGDCSFGHVDVSGENGARLIAELLPSLAMAGCVARRPLPPRARQVCATYRIHLGSGNILMAPKTRYLCIVPGSSDANPSTPVPAVRGRPHADLHPVEGVHAGGRRQDHRPDDPVAARAVVVIYCGLAHLVRAPTVNQSDFLIYSHRDLAFADCLDFDPNKIYEKNAIGSRLIAEESS